jgi:tetratricopeptide (TPR) repeat protein
MQPTLPSKVPDARNANIFVHVNDEYTTLFHRYISRSIESLLARLGPGEAALAPAVRDEAWLVLDQALRVAQGWEADHQATAQWQRIAHLLVGLAPRMEREGLRQEWLPFLERGVRVCQRLHDGAGAAQLSYYAGRLYRLRGDYGEARRCFAASLACYAALEGDGVVREGRARTLNQLAYVVCWQNEYAEAQAHVDAALTLLDEGSVERASSYWVLGTVAVAQSEWEEGIRQYQQAWELWHAAGDAQRAAWSLQNLGNALRGAGRYEEAAARIEQAIVLLGELHDPVNQAVARMNRGVVHLYGKDPAQACALFYLAEPVFRMVGDQVHLAMVYTNLCIGERDLGNWAVAAEQGNRALRFAEVLGNLKFQANAKDELGQVYAAQGEYSIALCLYAEGLAIVESVAPDPFQRLVHSSLSEHLQTVREKIAGQEAGKQEGEKEAGNG